MVTDDRSGDWDRGTRALLDAYRDAEREALGLPTYRLRSGESTDRETWLEWTVWAQVRRGEVNSILIFAPLVRALLASHIRTRLDLLRRAILASNELAEATQDDLLRRIDRQLGSWSTETLPSRIVAGLYKYALPIAGPLLLAVKETTGLSLRLTVTAGLFVTFYALGFLASAVSTKRALLLGGSASTSLNPARLEGLGVYGVEAQVFGPLAPPRREFPLDVALYGLYAAFAVTFAFAYEGLTRWIALGFLALVGVLALTFSILAFTERRRRGRW